MPRIVMMWNMNFPLAWSELEGIADRTDFDLSGMPWQEKSRLF